MQTMTFPKPPPGATPAQVQEAAAEILRRTSALLTTKATPAETSEIKEWLPTIAQATAEAAKKGGFLGFGGTSVSDQEKAAPAMRNAVLGLEVAQ